MDCKLSVLAMLLGVAAVVLSADEKSSTPATEAEGTIKIFRRLIPADVLRGKYRRTIRKCIPNSRSNFVRWSNSSEFSRGKECLKC